MKRKYLIVIAVALLCALRPSAQVALPDSTSVADSVTVTDSTDIDDDEENVIGGRTVKTKKSEANVLGMPVYYDTLGNVISGDNPSPSGGIYHRPRHHYLNNLGDNYCSFFAEVETMIGPSDLALGANFTYLPERWGAYTSVLAGTRSHYVSVGPALRLSDYDSRFDWHLYGGLVWGDRHIGCEGGLRFATPQRKSDFCWTSASMGLGVINGDTYLTVGLSIEILAIEVLGLLLF